MVVREDGTKWACQSCLKGHRVSGCNHTDRELTLVPKKGRPVTQCQHCRLERKKRSAHVKCDCGEAEKPHHPKEKCIHLREAEERAKAGFHEDHHKQTEDDPAHLTAVAEEQGCCCHHGGKCSCSLVKKESQNKGTSPPHGPAVQKPRLETTKSDGSITVFANGHHKPVHRKNHAAHECGMPYKMPMPRSHTEHNVAQAARRSVDSLPLSLPFNSAAFASQNMNTSAAERRLSKSEQPSPKITGCNGGLSDAQLSSVDFSSLGPIQTNQSLDSAVSDSAVFPSFEPMSGVVEGSFDPWSAFPSADSMPNNNPFGAWPTMFDTSNVPQPALTAASSGTQSEVDEIPAMEDLYSFQMPSIQEDIGAFNLDPVPNDGNNNRRSLPPNFFGNADFSLPDMTNEWQTPVGSVHGSDEGKSKALNGDQAIALPDAWSTPTMPAMTSIAQRSSGTSSSAGRPQSQSVGPGSAPSDDLIRQLFPDIDINNSALAAGNSPSAMGYAAAKRMGGLPLSNATSAAPGTDTSGFTSQPWNDGSLVVPNDDFTNTYGMDTEFSSPGFNDGWPYQ